LETNYVEDLATTIARGVGFETIGYTWSFITIRISKLYNVLDDPEYD